MPGAAAAATAEAPHAREERSLAEVEAGEPNRLSGAVRADALPVLVARPRPRSGLGQASRDGRATAARAAAAPSAAGWRELEGNRRAPRADKAGATKRDREGGSWDRTLARPGWGSRTQENTFSTGRRS